MTDITNHKDRAHSLTSPSAAHRWMKCTASARLEDQMPDTTSEAAAEGTLAHEICEAKLRHHFYTHDFNRKAYNTRIKELKTDKLYQSEMDGYTTEYKDFVHKAALQFESRPHVIIEDRLDITEFAPECFGTADCILIGGSTMHVIDFKYGKGVPVSADHNEQLMLYALGAYMKYQLIYGIDTIRMSIVQPRIDNNNSWECSTAELLEFGERVKQLAEIAYYGPGTFAPDPDACRFCRARNVCRARAEKNVELAGMMRPAELLTNDEVGTYIRIGQDVAKWLADLQDFALNECLAGRPVSGFKAVNGRGSRAWTDQEKAFGVLQEQGIDEALLYERVPISLAGAEKLVGKKQFAAWVGDLVVKMPGKPTLVPETDKREAITNQISAAEAFKEV